MDPYKADMVVAIVEVVVVPLRVGLLGVTSFRLVQVACMAYAIQLESEHQNEEMVVLAAYVVPLLLFHSPLVDL